MVRDLPPPHPAEDRPLTNPGGPTMLDAVGVTGQPDLTIGLHVPPESSLYPDQGGRCADGTQVTQ